MKKMGMDLCMLTVIAMMMTPIWNRRIFYKVSIIYYFISFFMISIPIESIFFKLKLKN